MKKLFGAFALITMIFAAALTLPSWTPPPPPTSFFNLHVIGFPIDTLTNTEADTLTFARNFDYRSKISFTINNVEQSGTATSTWVVQQSAYSSGTANWQTTDTLMVATATGNANLTLTNDPKVSTDNELFGYRIRLIGTNSGTGAHQYNINAIVRRL